MDHAFYADDITVWTNRAGSNAWVEDALQRAATTVHDYAKTCGLSCAPQKSELLMVQPGRPKKEPPPNVTITIDGMAIKPTQQIRILGLLLQSDARAYAAVTKIKNTSEQILSMIRRVSNRNRGLKEDDAMRLVRAFVVSRVTYSAPYLQLTKANRDTLNTMLRKATKQALGVPIYSSTQKLLDMGVHNTVEELIEAHLSNQRVRLSQTEHGRAVLRKIGWQIEPLPTKTALPEQWKEAIQTKPLPRNMQPGKDDGRRSARAKALARQLEENPRVLYADASLRKYDDRATAVATSVEKLIVSASLRTTDPAIAEEVAVALALVQPSVDTVVTDSKSAYASFRRGLISPAAQAILSKHKPPGRAIELVWIPAHSKVEGNALADHHARELSIRAEDEPAELPHPVTSFKDITKMYRNARCKLPVPHPQLTRQQQTILRRTQAGSLAHPVLLHRMYPAEHDTLCPFCKTERGTLAHIIAECKELKNPPPPLPPNTPNSQPPERWETLLSSPALPTQLALTARGQELLETYGSRE